MDRGYRIFDQVFERTDMLCVLDALSDADIARTRAGARHLMRVPAVRELSGDSRLLHIATAFVGPQPLPFRATLFDKSPNSKWLIVWHQDTALPMRSRIDHADWGPWSMKAGLLYAHAPAWALEQVVALRVSLDDSTITNGPLRVLPGTHRNGVLGTERIEHLARTTSWRIPSHELGPDRVRGGCSPTHTHATTISLDRSSDPRPRLSQTRCATAVWLTTMALVR